MLEVDKNDKQKRVLFNRKMTSCGVHTYVVDGGRCCPHISEMGAFGPGVYCGTIEKSVIFSNMVHWEHFKNVPVASRIFRAAKRVWYWNVRPVIVFRDVYRLLEQNHPSWR